MLFYRLRMAQEIQRKLEETEVKQKELESRGVSVEKSLRGEGGMPIFVYITRVLMLHTPLWNQITVMPLIR